MQSKTMTAGYVPAVKRKKKVRARVIVSQTMLLIYLLLILILTLMPLIITMIMSVKSPQDITSYPIWTMPKSGWFFSNYKVAFGGLVGTMLNTIAIDLISTLAVLFMGCFVAFLFERQVFPGKNVLFFVFIAPMMVPGAVLLSSTYIVVARWLNLQNNWLGLILPYIAGNQIATVFLLRVFMSQQPDSLYEACRLDGAGLYKTFVHLCLPLTMPIMMIQGIAIFAAIYNDYLWPLLLFQQNLSAGMLMPYMRTIVESYTQGVQYAMYLVAGIPLIITTAISIKFFISGDFASGMKL